MYISGTEAEPVSGIGVQDDAAVRNCVAMVVAVVLVDNAKHLRQNHLCRHVFCHQKGQHG